MTVIVAVEDEDAHTVVMAADRLSLDENDVARYTSKIWVDEDPSSGIRSLLGMAGNHAILKVVANHLILPPLEAGEGETVRDKWAQTVAEGIARLAAEHHLCDRDGITDGCGILAVEDRMWLVGHAFAEPLEEGIVLAVGVGAEAAYGAFFAMRKNTITGGLYGASETVDARLKARTAASAARAVKPGVGGRIDVEETTPATPG